MLVAAAFVVLAAGVEFALLKQPVRSGGMGVPGAKVVRTKDAPARVRPVYAMSVVPGGVYNAEEAEQAVASDAVVKAHYKDLKLAALRRVEMRENTVQFVSFRKKGRVYWTRHPMKIPAGEVVLTDGNSTVRARCGNRMSQAARKPTLPPTEPDPSAATLDSVSPHPVRADNSRFGPIADSLIMPQDPAAASPPRTGGEPANDVVAAPPDNPAYFPYASRGFGAGLGGGAAVPAQSSARSRASSLELLPLAGDPPAPASVDLNLLSPGSPPALLPGFQLVIHFPTIPGRSTAPVPGVNPVTIIPKTTSLAGMNMVVPFVLTPGPTLSSDTARTDRSDLPTLPTGPGGQDNRTPSDDPGDPLETPRGDHSALADTPEPGTWSVVAFACLLGLLFRAVRSFRNSTGSN